MHFATATVYFWSVIERIKIMKKKSFVFFSTVAWQLQEKEPSSTVLHSHKTQGSSESRSCQTFTDPGEFRDAGTAI